MHIKDRLGTTNYVMPRRSAFIRYSPLWLFHFRQSCICVSYFI